MASDTQSDTKRRVSIVNHDFKTVAPSRHIERQHRHRKEKNELGIALSELFLGLALKRNSDNEVEIGLACHDGTYTIDFAVHTLSTEEQESSDDSGCPVKLPAGKEEQASAVAEHLICSIRGFAAKNAYKFVGAGISNEVVDISPQSPSKLWLELDIVPIVVKNEQGGSIDAAKRRESIQGVDELADSMARKCLSLFGPSFQPRVQVGFSNAVDVDLGGRVRLTTLQQYKDTVSEQTWNTALKYASSLKTRNTKFAFFSATPQGGGVALMRHALIRFYRLLGVDCTWWVPKPKPAVFDITKRNHNILQGVAAPDQRLSEEQQHTLRDWVQTNADRFWTREGGPLAPSSQGGADVIIIDDPQMPSLIDISKKIQPDRPVIFRSHIQIRADLADQQETPTAGVWQWLFSSAKQADLFMSHPVSAFVPHDVKKETLAYMPATTDWLDGLNKELSDFDTAYYLHQVNTELVRQRANTLAYPERDYIAQIARFDPSKGIPDVLAAYAEFRRNSAFCKGRKAEETPQLVIAGHSSVDDPDGVRVLNETIEQLENEYSDIKDSVITLRLGPIDQLLNVLMSNARVALQLSTREGFEVKVSEALHKGVPIIATKAGGIPLQVHEKSGYLVETGDFKAVATYLDVLFSNKNGEYDRMSVYGASHVSDEVGTVGNAINWMFLADQLSQGKKLQPNGRWVWDLAREEAGEQQQEGEVRLPRDWST